MSLVISPVSNGFLRARHPRRRIIRLRKRVQTRLRSYLAAAYSAEVAFGYEGRACVSPHFLRRE